MLKFKETELVEEKIEEENVIDDITCVVVFLDVK